MADLVFFLDYAPLLSAKKQRAAMVLYMYYDKFMDSNRYVRLSYDDLHQCLGFSTRIIAEADAALQELGLISIPSSTELKEKGQFGRVKVRKVLPLKFLSDKARKQHYEEVGLPIHSVLRERCQQLHSAMPEYQQLIDLSSLEKACRELGAERFQTISRLVKFLKLDHKIAKLVLEDKEFKRRFKEMAQLAKDNVVGKTEVTTAKKKRAKKPRKSAQELYQQLMDAGHKTKKSKANPIPQELPVSEWKSQAILRYFCLKYKERYKTRYLFTSNPFNGREMGDCKRLLNLFDPEQIVAYLDWLFADQRRDITGPAVALYPNVINLYRRTERIGQQTGDKATPTEFVQWVKEQYPQFTKENSIATIVDIQWLQKLVQQNAGDDVMKAVVEYAIQSGVIS